MKRMPVATKDKHKYKAKECDLYIRLQEEKTLYVADFFTKDGTFVDSWAVPRQEMNFEDFQRACEAFAVIVWPQKHD